MLTKPNGEAGSLDIGLTNLREKFLRSFKYL